MKMASFFSFSQSRKAVQGTVAKCGLSKVALLAAAMAVAPTGLSAVEYRWGVGSSIYQGTWDISGTNWYGSNQYEQIWGPSSQGLNTALFVPVDPDADYVCRIFIGAAVRQAGISINGGGWAFSGSLYGSSPIILNNEATLHFDSLAAIGAGNIVFGEYDENTLSYTGRSSVVLNNSLDLLMAQDGATISVADPGATLTYAGTIISEMWDVSANKAGLGTLVLTTTPESLEGTKLNFTVREGTLVLAARTGLPIGGGSLTVNRGAMARLDGENDNLLSDTSVLILREGSFDLNGHTETIQQLRVNLLRTWSDPNWTFSSITNGTATTPGVLTVLGHNGVVADFYNGTLEFADGATVHLIGNAESKTVRFTGSAHHLFFNGGTLQVASGLNFDKQADVLRVYATKGTFKSETTSTFKASSLYLEGSNATDVWSVFGSFEVQGEHILVSTEPEPEEYWIVGTYLDGNGYLQLEEGASFSTAYLDGYGAIRNYSSNPVRINSLEKTVDGPMRFESGQFVVGSPSRPIKVDAGSIELAHGAVLQTAENSTFMFHPPQAGMPQSPVGLVAVGTGNRYQASGKVLTFSGSNILFGFDFDNAEQHFADTMLSIDAAAINFTYSGAAIGSSLVDIRNVSKLPSGIYSLLDVSAVNTVAPLVTTGELLLNGHVYEPAPRGTEGAKWLKLYTTNEGRKLEVAVMDAATNLDITWANGAGTSLWKNDDNLPDGRNWRASVNIGTVSIPVETYTDGDNIHFPTPSQNERIFVFGIEIADMETGSIYSLPVRPANMTVSTGGTSLGYVFAGEKIAATGTLTKTGQGSATFEADVSARTLAVQGGEVWVKANGNFEDGVTISDSAVLRVGSGMQDIPASLSADVSFAGVNSTLAFFLTGSDGVPLASEYVGTLTGRGTLLKQGEHSVLTLSGASNFDGQISVAQGEVCFVNALTGSASLAIADGASFALAEGGLVNTSGTVNIENNGALTIGTGTTLTAASVSFGEGSVLNIGSSLSITSPGTVSFNGSSANKSIINIISYDGVGEKIIVQADTIVAPNGFHATANGMTIPQVISSTDHYITASLNMREERELVLRSFLAWNNTEPGTFHGTFNINEGQVFTISQSSLPNGLRDNVVAAGGLGLGGWDGTTLTKRGAGELVLASPNTYTGDTVIEAGTLTIRDTLATGNKNDRGIVVQAGATLQISTIATMTYNKPIVGEGRLVKVGGYNATLTAASTYTGETVVGTGTLTVTGVLGAAGDEADYAGAIKLDGGSLILNQTRNQTLSGTISGSGMLTKRNTNTLALDGTHTHARTVIEKGNLQIGHDSSAPANLAFSGAVVLHPDARLLFDLFDSDVSDLLSVGSLSMPGVGKIEFDFNDKPAGVYTLVHSDSSLEEIFANPDEVILTKVAGIVLTGDTVTTSYSLSEDKKNLIFTVTLTPDPDDGGGDPDPDPEPWVPPSLIHDISWGGRASGRWNTVDANWKSIDGAEICFVQGDFVNLSTPASLVETVITVEAGQGTANEVHVAGMSVGGAGNIRVVNGAIHGYASSNGAGAFIKDGNGAFTFQNNTLRFEGGARVNAGTLILDGSSLEGSIAVAANSTLTLGQTGAGSRGSVTGRVENNGVIAGSGILAGQVINSGLLKPSGVANQIEIEGSLDNSRGVIHIQVAGRDPGAHGLISYDGTQALALDGTVRFEVSPQFIKINRNENTGRIELPSFLEKTGTGDVSISSDLAIVFTDISIYDVQLHDGTVSFSQNIAKIGAFHNGAKGYIKELNRLYLEGDELVMSLLDTHGQAASDAARAAAVTAIVKASPLSFAAMSALTVNSASGSLASLHSRLESRRYEQGIGGFETYFTASGSFVRNDSSTSSPVFDSNTYGVTAGFDTNASKHLFLGLNLGGHIGRANIHDSGGNIQQQEFRITAYASGMLSDFLFVDAALFGGFASYDTRRYTVLGEHKGETDGIHAGAAFYVGGALPLTRSATLNLTPYAGLEYIHTATDGFTEHGSDGLTPGVGAAYAIDAFSQNSLRAKIGTALTWVGAKGGLFNTRFSFNFAYARELLDTDVDIGARFARAARENAFTVGSRATPADILQLGPSVEFTRGDAALSFGYNFETSFDGEIAHQLNATFRLRF